MAGDLTIGAANVTATSGFGPGDGIAGENLTPGQPIYQKSSDNLYYRSSAQNQTLANAAGLTLNTAYTGQPIRFARTGTITLAASGALVTKGVPYAVSHNAGKIAPASDLGSGDFYSQIGIGASNTTIQLAIAPSGIAQA